jgi:predicted porin
VNIGSENSAMYLMHYAAPYVGAPINSGWVSTFVPADGTSRVGAFRTPEVSTGIDIGNDENVITYFSPRFSGFQVGATYAPAVVGSGNGKDFPPFANKETEFNNGFTVGANFVESFDNIDVAVSGGYGRAEGPDAGGGIDDQEMWSAGLNIGFAGFTVGGSYAGRDDDTMDGDAWNVGATYATGPWTVGGAYFHSDIDFLPDSAVEFNNEHDVISGGIGYSIGPGIDSSMTIMYADYDTDGGDADGIVGIVGITYSF